GAALDVLECEPADLASALLEQKERLILTPHSAGLTGEAAMRMSVSAAQNIIDYFNECLEPSLVVNPEVLAINAVMNPLPQNNRSIRAKLPSKRLLHAPKRASWNSNNRLMRNQKNRLIHAKPPSKLLLPVPKHASWNSNNRLMRNQKNRLIHAKPPSK
ncbi:hypothetical protein SK430_26485, partial [Escherichia coli]|nr:hypothetical protein [Escherichia coli]